MNIKDLERRNGCTAFSNFESFASAKGPSYYIAAYIKEFILKRLGLNLHFKDWGLEDLSFEEIEDLSEEERRINEENARSYVKRFWYYFNQEYLEPARTVRLPINIRTNVFESVEIDGKEYTGAVDIIIEIAPGVFTAINLKVSKPQLKRQGKLWETRLDKSLELMFLETLGQKLSTNRKAGHRYGHIIYLKNGNDKVHHVESTFNNRLQDISAAFSEDLVKHAFNEASKPCPEKKKDCQKCPYDYICNSVKAGKVEAETVEDDEEEEKKGKAPNDEQLNVIAATKGNLRVVAAPGSGKTYTIVERYINQVLEGEDVKDILMITFTNNAAKEMKDRIIANLKVNMVDVEDEDLNIFTFNELGQRILEEKHKYFGYSKAPTTIDKIEKFDILKEVLYKTHEAYPTIESLKTEFSVVNPFLNFFNARGSIYTMDTLFRTFKEKGLETRGEVGSYLLTNSMYKETPFLYDAIYYMYDLYNKTLKERNLVDYTDQIILPVKAFEERRKFMNKYKFKHIIVDEYQDSNPLELRFIKGLKSDRLTESLLVVGDPMQSIYGFKGTSPENLLNFNKDFQNVEEHYLSTNYRSSSNIVDFCSALEKNLSLPVFRKTKSVKLNKAPIKVYNLKSGGSLSNSIIDTLGDWEMHKGYNYKDMAIIGRTRADLKIAEEILLQARYPFVYDINDFISNNVFLEPVKNLARYFIEPNDKALVEYLGIIGKITKTSTLEKIEKDLEELKAYIAEEMERLEKEEKKNQNQINMIIFTSLVKEIQNDNIKKFIEENFERFILFGDFVEFLEKSVEYKSEDVVNEHSEKLNAITLTTAHSSKGKEWPCVIVMADSFKLKYINNNEQEERKLREKENDEEKRLFFVAASRAERELVITNQKLRGFNVLDDILANIGDFDIEVHS